MWGLVGLLNTLDYKLREMRTPYRELRAGELHVLYVPRNPCDCINEERAGGEIGSYCKWTKQKIVAYKDEEVVEVKKCPSS